MDFAATSQRQRAFFQTGATRPVEFHRAQLERMVTVLNGDANTAEALLRERFDKIFCTGSTRVGRAVLAAAAKHLAPVTLEFGGKCPAIVCADAPVELATGMRRVDYSRENLGLESLVRFA